MKENKLTIIASAALVAVLCISAVVFFTGLSQSDLPDCTHKITEEQREMSTYDLMKWFCETDYMTEQLGEYKKLSLSSQISETPFLPCSDHQAYYELIKRDDLHDAYRQLEAADDCPETLFLLTYHAEFTDIAGTEE